MCKDEIEVGGEKKKTNKTKKEFITKNSIFIFIAQVRKMTENNDHASENLSPFLKGKYEHIFHLLYDIQHDKKLSRQDFTKLQKKLMEMSKKDAEKIRLIQTRIGTVWTGIMKGSRFYRKNDLQMHVNVSEWLNYWTDFREAAKAGNDWPTCSLAGNVDYQWHSEFVDLIFDVMDGNGDGVIDEDEYVGFMKSFAYTDDDPANNFTNICQRNGDKIDRTHFKNMWYQYLMDEKAEDSPGNYLFGNVQS